MGWNLQESPEKQYNPEKLHSLKLTGPLKIDYFSREYIFQPLIFRCKLWVSGRIHIGYYLVADAS